MNVVRPFAEKDLMLVRNRDEGWTLGEPLAMTIAINSFAWTFEDDQGPFCIAGCYRFWQGVGSAWMVANRRMNWRKGVFITKHMRRLLQQYCEDNNIKRVGTVVDSRFHNYDKWVELLGFELEYVQLKAAPGNAGDLYGYVYWSKENGKITEITRN